MVPVPKREATAEEMEGGNYMGMILFSAQPLQKYASIPFFYYTLQEVRRERFLLPLNAEVTSTLIRSNCNRNELGFTIGRPESLM
jgi:hypothetical protein